MNGKIFLENGSSGMEFNNISEVLDYVCKNNINIDRIEYFYSDNDIQKFRKFYIK